MATPITIPQNISVIPVDLRSSHKTFTLPTVAQNRGRLLIFKDMYGNSPQSTMRFSTLGADRIEFSNVSTLALSNRYGAYTFTNDGINEWFLVDAYNNSLTTGGPYGSFINITDFTGLGGFFSFQGGVNGSQISSNRLVVNNAASAIAASAWYRYKANVTAFQMSAQFRMETVNGDGATFAIQNSALTALGGAGGGCGYQNILTSVAIRLDSYNGANGQFSTDILSNGTVANQQAASGVLNTALGLTAGGTWNLRLDVNYEPNNFFYRITNTDNNRIFTSNVSINVPAIVGAATAWIGFTGGTGGATQYTAITSWTYSA